ncbi:MAG: CoA transferase, partial [Betaproteobacteria bacterium]
ALLAGILGARATGKGRDLDTSLFDLALFNLNYPGTWYLNAGHVQGREKRGGHPSLVPSQLFRTRDGWLFVMCNKEKFWGLLAAALGHAEWASDPRYGSFKERLKRRDQVAEMVEAELVKQTTETWLKKLSGSVPVAPVFDIRQALDSPLVAERGSIQEFAYPDGRKAKLIANPIRSSADEWPRRAAPALGADTDALLKEIGYDAARIARLRAEGVIG